jgi:signal transduction histidine kinase
MLSAESCVPGARIGGIARLVCPSWQSLILALFRAAVPVLILAPAVPAHSKEQQSRVLFLNPDNEIPATTSITEGARHKFAQRSDLKIQLYREFLDLSRFPDPSHKTRTLSYLADKYALARPHALFAIGPNSLRIAIDNRAALAPGVPIVFCCVSPATLANIDLPSDATGIVSDFDIAKTVDLARRLQPNAHELITIAGAAPFDLRWIEIARRQLAPYRELTQRFLVGLSRAKVLEEVGMLRPDSIVVMLTMFKDETGLDFVPADIAAEIALASSAPTYSPYASWVGRGFVGGHSDTFESIGAQAGDLILKSLQGVSLSALPPVHSTTQAFRVDARQLERWGFSESRLPPDTIVMFGEPSIWDEHRNLVLATLAVIALLSAALATLALQVRRRRKAEIRLRQSDDRLNFAAASAGIGLWQYDPRTNQLWSSEHCRKMFGLTVSTPLTTEVMLNAVHPNDRHVALASVRAATFGSLDRGVSEFRVTDSIGHDHWIEVRGHTDVDRDGSVRVSGIFRDISAYKEAQLEAAILSKRLLSLQDDERERIAQEIHDSTAQHLAAIGLNLVALQGRGGPALSHEMRIIEDMRGSLREAVREVRTISFLLHPQALTKSGLNATLRRYAEGFERRTGIGLTLRTTNIADRCRLPQQLAVLRIVQEALANVHRHASATRASVKLRAVSDRLHLVVRDDGCGVGDDKDRRRLDVDALPLGVGIPGMTARVRHFGGTVDIRSGPLGTSVHVVMPIEVDAGSAFNELSSLATAGRGQAQPRTTNGYPSES